MTTKDVAKKLLVTTTTVQNWIKSGHLKGCKVGNEYHIDPLDFRYFTGGEKPDYMFLYK